MPVMRSGTSGRDDSRRDHRDPSLRDTQLVDQLRGEIRAGRHQMATPSTAQPEASLHGPEVGNRLDVRELRRLGHGQGRIDHLVVNDMNEIRPFQPVVGPERPGRESLQPEIAQCRELEDAGVASQDVALGKAEDLEPAVATFQPIQPRRQRTSASYRLSRPARIKIFSTHLP